jgi:hypothetical protein
LPRLPGFIGLCPVVAHTLLLLRTQGGRRATVDVCFYPEADILWRSIIESHA